MLIFPLRCDFSNFFQTAAVLKGFVVSKKCQTTYNFRECHMRKRARIVSSYHTVQGSNPVITLSHDLSSKVKKVIRMVFIRSKKWKMKIFNAREIRPTNKVRFMKSFNVTWVTYETQNWWDLLGAAPACTRWWSQTAEVVSWKKLNSRNNNSIWSWDI